MLRGLRQSLILAITFMIAIMLLEAIKVHIFSLGYVEPENNGYIYSLNTPEIDADNKWTGKYCTGFDTDMLMPFNSVLRDNPLCFDTRYEVDMANNHYCPLSDTSSIGHNHDGDNPVIIEGSIKCSYYYKNLIEAMSNGYELDSDIDYDVFRSY